MRRSLLILLTVGCSIIILHAFAGEYTSSLDSDIASLNSLTDPFVQDPPTQQGAELAQLVRSKVEAALKAERIHFSKNEIQQQIEKALRPLGATQDEMNQVIEAELKDLNAAVTREKYRENLVQWILTSLKPLNDLVVDKKKLLDLPEGGVIVDFFKTARNVDVSNLTFVLVDKLRGKDVRFNHESDGLAATFVVVGGDGVCRVPSRVDYKNQSVQIHPELVGMREITLELAEALFGQSVPIFITSGALNSDRKVRLPILAHEIQHHLDITNGNRSRETWITHDTMFQDLPALKKQFNQEIRTWETKYDELEKSNSFAEWVSLVAKQYVKMDPRFGTMEPRQLEMAIKEKARRSFFETAPQDFAYFHSRLEYSAWKTQIEFMKHKLEMNLEEILASLRDMSMESYLRHEPNKVFEASPRKYVHMVFPVTVSLPVRDSFVAELFKSVP